MVDNPILILIRCIATVLVLKREDKLRLVLCTLPQKYGQLENLSLSIPMMPWFVNCSWGLVEKVFYTVTTQWNLFLFCCAFWAFKSQWSFRKDRSQFTVHLTKDVSSRALHRFEATKAKPKKNFVMKLKQSSSLSADPLFFAYSPKKPQKKKTNTSDLVSQRKNKQTLLYAVRDFALRTKTLQFVLPIWKIPSYSRKTTLWGKSHGTNCASKKRMTSVSSVFHIYILFEFYMSLFNVPFYGEIKRFTVKSSR